MFRNKEFNLFLLATGLAGGILLALAFLLSIQAAIAVFVTELVFLTLFIVYTRYRYREIARLSVYLRKMLAGQYGLDIRDNREGELSLLKNEIFKVTERLSEYGQFMKRDKERLTDAISDISHQLKTPLTSMQVMLDLLATPHLPEEKRLEFLSHLQLQVERMDWLIISLLKLSKLDAGAVVFQKEHVAVYDVLDIALHPLQIPIEVKNIELIITGDRQEAFYVDRNWTAEALVNVLKNAVEHTPEGGRIELAISGNALYTELTIADNGKGVSKEDLPHLFKRFYKGKNASETSIGIGLALSHSIISAHNGTIEARRREEKGTLFRIKWYRK